MRIFMEDILEKSPICLGGISNEKAPIMTKGNRDHREYLPIKNSRKKSTEVDNVIWVIFRAT